MQCLRACFIFLPLMYMIKKEPTKESFLGNLGNWDMFGFERCFRKCLAFGRNHQKYFEELYIKFFFTCKFFKGTWDFNK